MKRLAVLLGLLVSQHAWAQEQEAEQEQEGEQEDQAPEHVDELTIFGDRTRHEIPGSAHTVTMEELERFEYDDIHRVLGSVSGVYIRQEDGFGLRPNIGMRGADPERSAKVALLEDGVLIAPAPYSAPAAYYFPLVTRMHRIEVLKGPAAIRHGPNTVGGAVNLVSRPIPFDRQLTLDVAGGQFGYGKLHTSYGHSFDHLAFLVEAVRLQSSGFKELDGGGDTGFGKNDVLAKGRWNTAPDADAYHQVDVKLGYSDETSNETYTGLAPGDFEDTPYRRYAATRLDEMNWTHVASQLTYRLEMDRWLTFTATAYHNRFRRSWDKLDGFVGASASLAEILADPEGGAFRQFYALLTGQADSTSDAEALLLGDNDRSYVSQGIETRATATTAVDVTEHRLSVGVRLHHDRVHRLRTERGYFMQGGSLVPGATADRLVTDTTGSALALSAHGEHEVRWDRLRVSPGLRVEWIVTEFTDDTNAAADQSAETFVWIPGVGAFFDVTAHLGLLAGVHRGFLPVAPGQSDQATPESSINYELGTRYSAPIAEAELVGFYSDYSNLKGQCSFSTGCQADNVDREFDGGAARVWGLEASARSEPAAGPVQFPLSASYTFTRARFEHGFSSDNPLWGEVMAGDALPYLPEHQGAVSAGIAGASWDASVSLRHVGTMRDTAGQGDEGLRIPAFTVLDAAASYRFGPWGTAYVTVDNALGSEHVVSFRPYGARPGKPLLVIVGYKNTL